MAVLVGQKAPHFRAKCVQGDTIQEVSLSDYHGRYVVLFFYPLDFTFVCPTELHAFQEHLKDFTERNTVVLGCSIDSHFAHLAWLNLPKSQGGIQGVTYGLLSDLGGKIARDYDVLSADEIAFRGLFLIDKEGIVRHQVVNDLPLGRSVPEALRTLDALQHFENYGEVCPANWSKNDKALAPTKEGVQEYFSKG